MKTIRNVHDMYIGHVFKEKLICDLYQEFSSHYYGRYLYKKPGFSLGYITRTPNEPPFCLLEYHNTIFQHAETSFEHLRLPDELDEVTTLQTNLSNLFGNSYLFTDNSAVTEEENSFESDALITNHRGRIISNTT